MSRSFAFFGLAAIFLLPMLTKNLVAKNKDKRNSGIIQSESLDQYLQRMQQSPLIGGAPSIGSLWVDGGRLADLGADYKARHVGDLITITVVQNITATNSGSVSSTRNLSASSGISALPAQLKTANFASLFSPTSAYSLAGKGQAATTSSLTTSLAGRVVAVLSSGALVIEAERELTMNNERQTVLLRGLVRPGDIAPNGAVPSNAIANLELELKGKGVISEGNRPPNIIVRAILRVVGF
ncbi:MAG TPA: flagellar basal body L-ring protein FlgH [Terriglobales bacterium]|nr:flagellar basal body L-ring protein FlgH [Terriglobales bacterium]